MCCCSLPVAMMRSSLRDRPLIATTTTPPQANQCALNRSTKDFQAGGRRCHQPSPIRDGCGSKFGHDCVRAVPSQIGVHALPSL